MAADRLLIETQHALDEARELLDELPPLSPDHESVRVAVVKLRRTQESLVGHRDLSSRTLRSSHQTMDEARTVIAKVRESVTRRSRRHVSPISMHDGAHSTAAEASRGTVAVFLDADTVLFATHQGRYGRELGLQADLSDGLGRLSEIADRIVVVVDPPSPDSARIADTPHRVDLLRSRLDGQADGLVIATCPHGEDGSCSCAKPGHELIAANLGGAAAHDGWYVGGDQEGMVSGRTAGLRTIRIGPHGEDHLSNVHRPDYEARDLMDAANHIMLEALAAP